MLVIIRWDIGRNIFVPRLSPFDTFANHKCEQNNDKNKSNYKRQMEKKNSKVFEQKFAENRL